MCGGTRSTATTPAGAATPYAPTPVAQYKCGHWAVLVIALVFGYAVGRLTK